MDGTNGGMKRGGVLVLDAYPCVDIELFLRNKQDIAGIVDIEVEQVAEAYDKVQVSQDVEELNGKEGLDIPRRFNTRIGGDIQAHLFVTVFEFFGGRPKRQHDGLTARLAVCWQDTGSKHQPVDR